MRIIRSTLLAGLWAVLPVAAQAGQEILHLDIGDPARKGREIPVVLDGITDTANGQLITPATMAERLKDTGILFIGENHTNQDFHNVQFQAIRALHEAGREVLIGLEMFPYTQQASLDAWTGGLYTEPGFVDLAGWYEYWGYNWAYYREIFLYAKANGIRMYGVNSPRDVVKSVRTKGFQDLSPEEAAHVPPKLAPENDEHRTLYQAAFSKDDALHMKGDALEGLYRAQTMWDATMGWNALQALKAHGGPKAIMVVLIGAGHVTYGLGAERQIRPWYQGGIASLVPVSVLDDDSKPVKKVRASYANFVWGVPQELAPIYPSLGVSLMGNMAGKEPGQVIQVSGDSPAARAGIKVGDILLAVNGTPITSETGLRKVMAPERWADAVRVKLRREGQEQELDVPLRR